MWYAFAQSTRFVKRIYKVYLNPIAHTKKRAQTHLATILYRYMITRISTKSKLFIKEFQNFFQKLKIV